ncbi:MAG TPA: histidine kinase, partial [Caldilineaceae bacterium]|nr:histidine kinase [Caldilineaceae bacterium]
ERVLPVEQSFLEQAVQNGQPVVISNLAALLAAQSPPATSHSEVLLSNVFRTLLAVPLVGPDGGEVYGGIALYYPQERQFSDEEIALVATFAAQAALAIENARLRERAGLAAVMEERGRLARELHDSVTQQLYSLTLLAEGWRRMAQNGQLSGVEEALAELGQLGQQALKEMRLLVHELRPPALEQDGLLGALHQRLAAVERRAGVEARLVANDLCELPAALEAGVYRIAQEALNNALKHAEATTVTVALHCNADSFTLT